MNPEIKAEWIRDLRDGTRVQGTERLRDEEGRQCCLDVLCEQAVRKGITPAPVLLIDGYAYKDMFTGGRNYNQINVLPRSVMEWADLGERDPIIDSEDYDSLSYLNDTKGCTFEEIADIIENSDL